MKKSLLITLAALLFCVANVSATDNEIPAVSKQFVVQVLNSQYNWFDQCSLLDILQGALQLLNETYTFNGTSIWDIETQGSSYYDGIWHPSFSPASDSEINEFRGVVNDLQNWLGYDGSQYNFHSAALETMAQQTLSQGEEVLMMGTDDIATEGNVNSSFTMDESDFSSNHNLYFVGRCTTWPGGGNAVGNNSMFRIVTDDNAAYTFHFSGTQSPLVLDMNGDGKLEASNGEWLPHKMNKKGVKQMVSFDMNCDGFKELTEWVGANDGLLMVPGKGEVTAANLFGNEGGKYKNGYEKLSLLDANKDQKITGDELKTLYVWQDKNHNAKVDKGETATVVSLGITEIGLKHKAMVSYFIQNGKRKVMWDWYPCVAPVKRHKK